jgi:hypothetical protein
MFKQYLTEFISVFNDYVKFGKKRPVIAGLIIFLPLLVFFTNYIVMSQIPDNLSKIAVSNGSDSYHAKRVEEVIRAYAITENSQKEVENYLYIVVDSKNAEQKLSNGEIDVIIDIPQDFGNENQNDRISGELEIKGDSGNTVVRIVENVIDEALDEFNSDLNNNLPTVSYYSTLINVDKNISQVFIPKLNNYLVFLSIPALFTLLFQAFRIGYKSWAGNSFKKILLNSYLDFLVVFTVALIVQLILIIASYLVYGEYQLSIFETVLYILMVSIITWFAALVLAKLTSNNTPRSQHKPQPQQHPHYQAGSPVNHNQHNKIKVQ